MVTIYSVDQTRTLLIFTLRLDLAGTVSKITLDTGDIQVPYTH